MAYEFEGIGYRRKRNMLAARTRYVEHVLSGADFTEAVRAVGVSKRTGKVWRNSRTRGLRRNPNTSRQADAERRAAQAAPQNAMPAVLSTAG